MAISTCCPRKACTVWAANSFSQSISLGHRGWLQALCLYSHHLLAQPFRKWGQSETTLAQHPLWCPHPCLPNWKPGAKCKPQNVLLIPQLWAAVVRRCGLCGKIVLGTAKSFHFSRNWEVQSRICVLSWINLLHVDQVAWSVWKSLPLGIFMENWAVSQRTQPYFHKEGTSCMTSCLTCLIGRKTRGQPL